MTLYYWCIVIFLKKRAHRPFKLLTAWVAHEAWEEEHMVVPFKLARVRESSLKFNEGWNDKCY